jgi:hypothetical protein
VSIDRLGQKKVAFNHREMPGPRNKIEHVSIVGHGI